MLRFPVSFINDDAIDHQVKQFINNRILALLHDQLILAPGDHKKVEEIKVYDPAFCEYASMFLPDTYPRHMAGQELLKFYHLLQQEIEQVPSIVQEYALNHLITVTLEISRAAGTSTVERMPGHEQVLAALAENLKDYDSDIKPEDVILCYEDLKHYSEFCFFDMDYALLDEFQQMVEKAVEAGKK